MARATSAREIDAKRANSKIGVLRKKAKEGKTTGEERASVRVGKVNTKVLTGQEDLSTWSDEELQRGQKLDKNGQFRGQAPVIVPKALHDELVRRTLSKANELFRSNLVTAVENLTAIATDKTVEPKDRLKAIQLITDRAMGKAPEKVEVTGEAAPWQIALTAGIVSIKGNIVDSVDDSGDDDEDGD